MLANDFEAREVDVLIPIQLCWRKESARPVFGSIANSCRFATALQGNEALMVGRSSSTPYRRGP
jgi:hypothetical protein